MENGAREHERDQEIEQGGEGGGRMHARGAAYQQRVVNELRNTMHRLLHFWRSPENDARALFNTRCREFIKVCMYVCMCVCMYACMYAYMYICMYICKYVYMYVRTIPQ